jgi:flagellin-like hook-associated protein FlgL
VDFVELTVSFPSTSSSASGGSITTPQRVGSEFQVNTYTAGEQTKTNIASLSGGGFVGTWMSNGQDGSGEGVYGQIYDASGNAVGSEFLINSETNNNQDHPSVTGLSDGGFVVAWESTVQDGSGDGVYGQRYDASAAAIGVEFKINTHTSNEQRDIHLASLEGGGFVANWISYNQDGNIWGIYGQRFDSSGNAAGAEFRINTHTANNQQHAQISSLPDGGFLAMFGSDSSTHAQPDTSSFGAYGQRYDSSGNPVGAEFRINSTTTGHQYYATATGLKNGDFVITWSSYGQDDASGHGIYGQRYEASGTVVGSEFKVNTNNSNDQHYSSITSLDDGGFLVVWQSSEQDGSGTGIYGQRYASNAETVGSEFVINSTTNNDQARASVTSVSDGNIVVAWSSAGQDGDGNGIFAQIFDTGASSSSGSSSSSSSSSTESSSSSDSSSSSSSGPTLDSPPNAMAAITAIDNAIKTVNIQRSKLGAVSNRLSHTVNNLTNISSNLSAVQGGIEDADFAKETTDLAKNQILQQASTAMLAQANASKQNVLSLLQG